MSERCGYCGTPARDESNPVIALGHTVLQCREYLRGALNDAEREAERLRGERDRLLSERNPMHVSMEAQSSAVLCALQNANIERDLMRGVVEAARGPLAQQETRLRKALAALDSTQGKDGVR